MKGRVGGGAAGTAEHRKHWTTALVLRSSGRGKHTQTQNELKQRAQPGKDAARRVLLASLPHVKLASITAPGPSGERQQHLDAIIAFAGAGQGTRMFRVLDVLTVKWATGDLPGECRFLLHTQLMFLKKEKNRQRNCSMTTRGLGL